MNNPTQPQTPPELLLAFEQNFNRLEIETVLPPDLTMELKRLLLNTIVTAYSMGKGGL